MNSSPRAVVVTGTSSGIGKAVTQQLADAGLLVFAGVRRQADFDHVRAAGLERVKPLLFDVTDPRAIDRATRVVAEQVGERGLAGLVNNAGMSCGGVLEHVNLEELRKTFEVNVFGVLLVTRAFLPLLRRGCGRIVNISSGLGQVALPLVGGYSMSKHALEAMSDALRLEVRRSGVHVSIVQPGVVDTPMIEKGNTQVEREHDALPSGAPAYYSEAISKLREQFDNSKPSPPADVARVVRHALTVRRPRARYKVGIDAKMLTVIESILPIRMRDRLFGSMVGL